MEGDQARVGIVGAHRFVRAVVERLAPILRAGEERSKSHRETWVDGAAQIMKALQCGRENRVGAASCDECGYREMDMRFWLEHAAAKTAGPH
jgi:hypothetical protein